MAEKGIFISTGVKDSPPESIYYWLFNRNQNEIDAFDSFAVWFGLISTRTTHE